MEKTPKLTPKKSTSPRFARLSLAKPLGKRAKPGTRAPAFLLSRPGLAMTGAGALAIAYALGLKAIDTGKLQYYFLVFVLLVFAVNRLVKIVRYGRG